MQSLGLLYVINSAAHASDLSRNVTNTLQVRYCSWSCDRGSGKFSSYILSDDRLVDFLEVEKKSQNLLA